MHKAERLRWIVQTIQSRTQYRDRSYRETQESRATELCRLRNINGLIAKMIN